MRSAAVEDLVFVDWSADAYRLIPSRFPPVALYAGLVHDQAMDALVRVEDLTNPRLLAERRIARMSTEAPGSPRLQNWNLAPFAYENPEGSVFFGPKRPCLELADGAQTALAVSVARRKAFLERTAEAPTGLDMRMLKARVQGRFVDLRAQPADADRPSRRALGERIPADVQGVLFHPRERPTATALAVLDGRVLGRAVQAVHYRFVWDGRSIGRLYAFDEEGRVLPADMLGGAADVLAA